MSQPSSVSAAPTLSARAWRSPVVWLSTGFGAGFSPYMPGTVGALWGLPLAWALAQLPAVGMIPATAVQALALVACLLGGVVLCTRAEQLLGVGKDPQSVVWDEIATVAAVFFLVPAELMSNPLVLLAGFLLHRVFDVTKPPPVRQLERLPQGWGIMADDVMAALYAWLCLHGLLYLRSLA